MADPRILVLADDLTGALEVGAKFAAAGVRSQVRTGPSLLSRAIEEPAGVLVVDTESRHVEAAEATRRVHELARAALHEGYARVYKKTDSTLRGNIGAELAALVDAYAGSPLLYVPGYPQMGRTVRNGSLYVDGILVGATAFASDPLNPAKESHIPTLLAAQCRLPIRLMAEVADPEPGCIAICDGESDADVESAAKAFTQSSVFRLAAGPAAFATHLARLVDIPHTRPPALPNARTALIVNGSLHPVSVTQVEQAKRDGFKTIDSRSISRATAGDDWIILEQGSGGDVAPLDFAKCLARSVCGLLARVQMDALVVFGGDTAFALVEALGHPPLLPLGELMEGVPISRIEANRLGPTIGPRACDLYLVTKAGGFGPVNVLASLRDLLRER